MIVIKTINQDYPHHLSCENMFQRMSVESSRSYGSSPLMMNLVNVFVDEFVV